MAPAPKLVVVLGVFPSPPRRNGVALRFRPILDHLAARYRIHLIVVDDPTPAEEVARAQLPFPVTFVAGVEHGTPVILRKLKTLTAALLPWGAVYGNIRHRSYDEARRTIVSVIEAERCDMVLWAGGLPELAIDLRRACRGPRFTYDFIDSIVLHARRAVPQTLLERIAKPMNVSKCERLEKAVRRSFDSVIYISDPDARALPSSPAHGTPVVVPNGVLPDSARVEREHRLRPSEKRPIVGFLGAMSYGPNVRATLRLVHDILPRIDRQMPGVQVKIIGRDPAPEICALRSPQVEVTGFVSDIWAAMESVDVFVFPMLSGAGLQNKILEAMYFGVPVVTTPIASGSLTRDAQEALLVSEDDDGIAELVLQMLRDAERRQQLAEAARDAVRRDYSWQTLLQRYESVLRGDTVH